MKRTRAPNLSVMFLVHTYINSITDQSNNFLLQFRHIFVGNRNILLFFTGIMALIDRIPDTVRFTFHYLCGRRTTIDWSTKLTLV
mgnify:FL=1